MMTSHLVSRSPFLVRLCLLDLLRIPFQLPTLLHQDDAGGFEGDGDGVDGDGDCVEG